jgi:cytochrome c
MLRSTILWQFIVLVMLLLACKARPAREAAHEGGAVAGKNTAAGWPQRFGFGHPAPAKLIEEEDIDIHPDGSGLPAGEGNAITGSIIYTAKCAACHGTERNSGKQKLPGPLLFAHPDSVHIKTIGNYWPYTTTIYDYIRRSMPYNAPGSLSNNEVYALTAYLVHANGIIDSATVINASNLAGVRLPARERFVKDDRKGGKEIK